MLTVHLSTVNVPVLATRCQYQLGGYPANEQVWTALKWWPPDVSSRGWGELPSMWPIPWSMWYLPIPPQWTDRCLWKHYLPATTVAGINKCNNIYIFKQESIPVGCILPTCWPYPIVYHAPCIGGGWVPTPLDIPTPREQTPTCENIIFPQLHLRAVKIKSEIMFIYF